VRAGDTVAEKKASQKATLRRDVEAFTMLINDPQRAHDEWLGRIEGVRQPDLDVLEDVREWATYYYILKTLPKGWPQARRDEFAALGINYRCSCYEGCHYMVCAHVLAQQIHEIGMSAIPAAFSTVQVSARAGAGMPQNGANMFGAPSAYMRSKAASKPPVPRGIKRRRGAT
jgi:hypothetical protein